MNIPLAFLRGTTILDRGYALPPRMPKPPTLPPLRDGETFTITLPIPTPEPVPSYARLPLGARRALVDLACGEGYDLWPEGVTQGGITIAEDALIEVWHAFRANRDRGAAQGMPPLEILCAVISKTIIDLEPRAIVNLADEMLRRAKNAGVMVA